MDSAALKLNIISLIVNKVASLDTDDTDRRSTLVEKRKCAKSVQKRAASKIAARPPPFWLLFTFLNEIGRGKQDRNSALWPERFRTFFWAFFFALNFGWGS